MTDAIRELERQRLKQLYLAWEEEFLALPANAEMAVPEGMTGDIELQPLRWLRHALDLIGKEANEFPPRDLPQAVFQYGAELFLKGMWLCQHEQYRTLAANGYVSIETRRAAVEDLKDRGRGHSIFRLINRISTLECYREDGTSIRFLKIVRAIAATYYQPLGHMQDWATARYPIRYYNDAASRGVAQLFTSRPQRWTVQRLFARQFNHLNMRWQLEENLLALNRAERSAQDAGPG